MKGVDTLGLAPDFVGTGYPRWKVLMEAYLQARDLDVWRVTDEGMRNGTKSNSNSLANQLGIHIILAKQEKLASNSLANQLGKNRNLEKLTSPRADMRARIVVAIVVSL
jgi:hypothetical protein